MQTTRLSYCRIGRTSRLIATTGVWRSSNHSERGALSGSKGCGIVTGGPRPLLMERPVRVLTKCLLRMAESIAEIDVTYAWQLKSPYLQTQYPAHRSQVLRRNPNLRHAYQKHLGIYSPHQSQGRHHFTAAVPGPSAALTRVKPSETQLCFICFILFHFFLFYKKRRIWRYWLNTDSMRIYERPGTEIDQMTLCNWSRSVAVLQGTRRLKDFTMRKICCLP